jgi:hypothetical protein
MQAISLELKRRTTLSKRLTMLFGGLAVTAGLTLFAVGGFTGSPSALAGNGEDDTPAAGATGTATAGPLTPVASPTVGGGATTPTTGDDDADDGAGGADTGGDDGKVAGGAELPTTGTGSAADSGGIGLIALLGMGLAVVGGGFAIAGARRI